MKVALVHDYLIQDGGAERVLLALHEIYPSAPIFTLFYDPAHLPPAFAQADIRPSHLNRLPFAKRHYQWYLPFMAQAVETFDLNGFDVVISSSSNFAKGILVAPNATHICYCHTPTRFLWQDRVSYVNELPQPKIVKWILPRLLHGLRQWDRLASERPDLLITNSQTSQARIQRYYRRDAAVIHPPVDVDRITPLNEPGSYWLAGGRLVAYKRFDLIVQAFAKLNLPLKIFGEGPELPKLKKLAGPKTELLGHIDEAAKIELYRRAIAFIHPQLEDFGITPVEAMAAGRPVIAYGQGGATETVIPGVTGEFLEVACWEDIGNAVIRFDQNRYSQEKIRAHAETFSRELFQKEMKKFVEQSRL
ncbi:glycosyltransferase family 4 protein [Candidatus Uhrbacteria bacterium]|nr:glycosyltransferase family 4 protein [Candidatus Uhrbacteria bacterium]